MHNHCVNETHSYIMVMLARGGGGGGGGMCIGVQEHQETYRNAWQLAVRLRLLWTQSSAACQSVQNQPPTFILHLWTLPTHPWQRHMDYAGTFMGSMYFKSLRYSIIHRLMAKRFSQNHVHLSGIYHVL